MSTIHQVDTLPKFMTITVTSTSTALSALVTTASETWPESGFNRITVKHSGTVYVSDGTASATTYSIDSGEVLHGGQILKGLNFYAAGNTTVQLAFWQEGY